MADTPRTDRPPTSPAQGRVEHVADIARGGGPAPSGAAFEQADRQLHAELREQLHDGR